ncbi:Inner membrane amino-acid ABC transporter permease protein yecS,amino acid ABC transporter permease,ABC-type amino acid transport system, permease component,ectoine/hydroxyectoine ABC transporter, permease protein EhuC,Binding-protein-dependent transport system inner membrane component [Chlamydia serpentis]|uniref:ABC transmembrane type-1 domain-containing protein n=1 Tax=Chlamydia serpentis TaxID=1967782 RepID=A0A2R8FAA0_9CHLA|nr:amino acid ABC transporter permease [Chlamydia serpentis]SPN73349.1 Inner membrane amino-acid ABC transporter permease protein yecS,amino acid ABC transporter permease,ABC-type amino acid transport system, permease component,ectoine/hydroxyectoine ABC transporter, permease protein EhuC,Binding-protein-dependent transport system inner membrane component [Chlamydia serpentis]
MDHWLLTTKLLLRGCGYTLFISGIGICCGSILGLLIGTVTSLYFPSRLTKFLANSYVTIIRGTPLFIQILIVYFGLPGVVPIEPTPLVAGIIALSMNSAAYLAENIRGGINSLSIGQWESAIVLGYKKHQIFIYIIYPQVIKNILPSLTNEFVSLIKESSILMVVGVPELTKVTKDIVSRELNPMEMYLVCAGLYFLMTTAFSCVARLSEKRRSYDN